MKSLLFLGYWRSDWFLQIGMSLRNDFNIMINNDYNNILCIHIEGTPFVTIVPNRLNNRRHYRRSGRILQSRYLDCICVIEDHYMQAQRNTLDLICECCTFCSLRMEMSIFTKDDYARTKNMILRRSKVF